MHCQHDWQLLWGACLLLLSGLVLAQTHPLPASEAFTVTCQSPSEQHYTCTIHPASTAYHVDIDTVQLLKPSPGYRTHWQAINTSSGDTRLDWQSQETLKTVTLSFQGCAQASVCYPPTPRTIQISSPQPASSLWRYLSFLGTGLLLSLTPCVWPLFPLLLSILSKNSALAHWKISGVYVLGVSSCYALLGGIAHQLGFSAQFFIQSPWVLTLSALLLLILAYQQWGAWQLIRPSQRLHAYQTRLLQHCPSRLLSAFFVGFLGALILSPCISGPVLAALGWSMAYPGFESMLTMGALGLGLSLPLMLVSYFSPKHFQQFPQYTQYFNIFIGGALLLSSLILLSRLPWFPHMSWWRLSAITLMVTLMHHMTQQLKYSLSLLTLLISTLVFFHPTAPLTHHSDSSLFQLMTIERPTILIFHADWCEECHRLKQAVFDDEAIQVALSHYHCQWVDLTTLSEAKQQLMAHYHIIGPPQTVIILPGQDPINLVGFFSKRQLLSTLELVAHTNADPIK